MKKFIRVCATSIFGMILSSAALFAQTVSNVSVSQEGKNVVVSYNIDKASPQVSLTVSTDGGKTFSAPLQKVSGDIRNVQPGRRSIVWDVLAERENLVGDNIMFNVVAGNGYECVDLGLSVKWATCNLGASKPEEYGGYYQWAGTKDVTDESIYLGWNNCPYHTGSDYRTGWTKYIPSGKSSYWSGSGSPDNKTVLDLGDDVAHVKLGGKWRMPTNAEWRELIDNCTWTKTTQNGAEGYKVTSKKSGYTNKSIFLPSAGSRFYGYLDTVGFGGRYWSSSLGTVFPDCAYLLSFSSDRVGTGDGRGRCNGYSVRPVSE